MPLPKPAFFQSDKRPQWRSAVAGLAIGLRLRFRKNPGFTMATAAGSIGLLLALFLLLSGGLSRFSKGDADEAPEIASDLGDEAEIQPEKAPGKESRSIDNNGTLASLEESRPTRRPSPSEAPSRKPETSHDRDESLLGDDESTDSDSEFSVVSRSSDSKRGRETPEEETAGDPFNSDRAIAFPDDRDENEDKPVPQPAKAAPRADTIASLHDDREEEDEADTDDSIATSSKGESRSSLMEEDEPAADETEVAAMEEPVLPSVTKPEKRPERLLADDEPLGGSSDDEENQPASRPATTTVVKTPSKASPPVPPIGETDDGSFAPPQTSPPRATPTDSSSPAQSSSPKSGWKYSTTKPQVPRESTGRSQAVETAVYAAPEAAPATVPPQRVPDAESTRKAPPREKRGTSPLALAMAAPRNVSAGQVFDIEFTVTNTGRETVRGLILSVQLPPGLAHDLGPELEQPIEMLSAGQMHRSRLRVKATGTGDITPRADVAIKGRLGTSSRTTLRVGATGGASTRAIPPCACEPPVRYVW